ncbi:MAG: DUF503 domain-containing protein [Clostridia bacterium]|nr:DUF503 domain-containing protein [Clostridia bacterium]
MIIGTITFKIHIPYAHSLKEKRSVVKSIIAKIQNKFNLSVAEIDLQNQWQFALIGVAMIANKTKIIEQQITRVIEFLDKQTEFEVIEIKTDIF